MRLPMLQRDMFIVMYSVLEFGFVLHAFRGYVAQTTTALMNLVSYILAVNT